MKKGELQEFLDSNPSHLTLEAKVYVGRELSHTIDIELPIDTSKILLSERFTLGNEISFEYGKITLEELTISSTRMRLDVGFEMLEGYFFTGFDTAYLMDKKGNHYTSDGIVSTTTSESERTFYFVPSLFFKETPTELSFYFEGIRVGSTEGKGFTLGINDLLPKTLSYMGEDITINEFYYENDSLIISVDIPNNTLKFQGIDLVII